VHLTAEAVHSRAQARLPEISLATVYNTLNELVTMGQVLEVPVGAGAKRYDPNAHLQHQHLVCTRCGELRDVLPEGGLALDHKGSHGYEITGVQVVFQGICPSCSSRPPAL
jgi:Fur family ferric uptake transcriptional regulator